MLNMFDNVPGSDYYPKAWLRYFHDNPDVSNDLNKIIGKCHSMISRDDVRYFAHQAQSGGYEELRRLFLACMIWGWGKGGKYKRGFRNTEAALSDSRLRETLEQSVERIKNAQIKEAYEGFDLKGCGDAFFTKFFYFVGQEWGVRPLPLILDSRVRSFLGFLREQEGWDESLFANANGYLQYIYSIDSWAKEIGCPVDNMEYFMFKEVKKIGQNTNREAEKSMSKEEKRINEEQEVGKMNKGGKALKLKFAYEFAAKNGMPNLETMIGEMNIPQGWSNQQNLYVRKGEIVQCLQSRLGLEWISNLENYESDGKQHGPIKKDYLVAYDEARINFEKQQEGIDWLNNHKMPWLKQASAKQSDESVSLAIILSQGQDTELKKLTGDLGLNNDADTARILISLFLRLLR